MRREMRAPRPRSGVRSGLTVALVTALLTATLMSSAFSYYLYRQHSSSDEHRARLQAATDRNALLQKELLNLNSSVAGVMTGLDTVWGAVNTAKTQLQLAEPSRRAGMKDLAQLEDAVQNLKRENEQLKVQAARIAAEPPPAPAPVQPQPKGGAATGGAGRWLTIGIPTVPRKHGERYLEQTMNAIVQQLPLRQDDPLFDRVMVVVLNNKPGQHSVFDQVRSQYESGAYARYFKFVEQEIAQTDSYRNAENNPNVPSSKVRRQTRAAIAMLRASAGLAGHFIFMEDDFILCPHALYAMQYIISKAYAYKPIGFSGIRVSYGLCGVILNDKDVHEFANYLEQHQVIPPLQCISPQAARSC